jgi:hypothetical protein
MRRSAIFLLATATLFHPMTASAQSAQAALVATCTNALVAGNTEAASLAAEEMIGWRFLTRAELVEPAASCITQVTGEPWSYDKTAGRFRPDSEFTTDPAAAQQAAYDARVQADAENARRQEELNAAAVVAKKIEDERRAHIARVRAGVILACRKLWQSDPDAAFTNAVCVESFLRDGMPNG